MRCAALTLPDDQITIITILAVSENLIIIVTNISNSQLPLAAILYVEQRPENSVLRNYGTDN